MTNEREAAETARRARRGETLEGTLERRRLATRIARRGRSTPLCNADGRNTLTGVRGARRRARSTVSHAHAASRARAAPPPRRRRVIAADRRTPGFQQRVGFARVRSPLRSSLSTSSRTSALVFFGRSLTASAKRPARESSRIVSATRAADRARRPTRPRRAIAGPSPDADVDSGPAPASSSPRNRARPPRARRRSRSGPSRSPPWRTSRRSPRRRRGSATARRSSCARVATPCRRR